MFIKTVIKTVMLLICVIVALFALAAIMWSSLFVSIFELFSYVVTKGCSGNLYCQVNSTDEIPKN